MLGIFTLVNWRVGKHLVVKRLIQVNFYFYEIRTKIQAKEERLNFLKT